MKNRHQTPATTPQFGGISLINRQLRTIVSNGEACFVSISVYFCLLLSTSSPLISASPGGTYASNLAQLFHRDLHEQQRLQAIRNRQLIAAYMVMDVDLSVVSGVADGSSSSRGD